MPLTPAEIIGKPTAKRTMFVARADGRLYSVDFSESPQLDDPALIDWNLSVAKILIGKMQLSRTRYITVEEIEFENATHTGQPPPGATADLALTIYNSMDGKNPTSTVNPTIVDDGGGLLKAVARVTGQNFSIQLRGNFNLNTLVLTTHQNGRR